MEGSEPDCESPSVEECQLPILNGLLQIFSLLSSSLGTLKPDGLLSSIAYQVSISRAPFLRSSISLTVS